jgi:hypothetical protein
MQAAHRNKNFLNLRQHWLWDFVSSKSVSRRIDEKKIYKSVKKDRELTHCVEGMELDPAEGEEAEDCLEDRLADAHHAGGEGRAHRRTQELRVRQHATAHWTRNRMCIFF